MIHDILWFLGGAAMAVLVLSEVQWRTFLKGYKAGCEAALAERDRYYESITGSSMRVPGGMKQ